MDYPVRLAIGTFVTLLAVGLNACASGRPDLAAEKAALLELDREWAAAAAANHDLERIVSYWSDNAIVIPPGRPAVVGKEALRAMVAATIGTPGFSVWWEVDEAHISANGRMAYMLARNRFTVPAAGGGQDTLYGRGIAVWRKNAAGDWKCVAEIWNAPAPGDPAAVVDEVRELSEFLFTADVLEDPESLYGHYSPDVAMLRDGQIVDWARHKAQARGMLRSLRKVINRPLEYRIIPLGPDAALWSGLYEYRYTDLEGQVMSGTAAQTWVFRRTPDGWRIVHVHVSRE